MNENSAAWAEVIFREVCDRELLIPDRPLPSPDEVAMTEELARLMRESHA